MLLAELLRLYSFVWSFTVLFEIVGNGLVYEK